ncbi:hypothetical protein [Halobacillus litoralis]|uniref:hypothetical protein n=1 Tax=Halobacillus litoralis TaxID=45668 RepID=UPI001CFE2286|nr:hypothetical protein [Halobacillus litoralis]
MGVKYVDRPSYQLYIQGNVSEGVVFTDENDQEKVDTFLDLYLHKDPIEGAASVDVGNPDLSILFTSPGRSIDLIESRVWFTDQGAVLGERIGETWRHVQFFSITNSSEDYLRSLINEREEE